MNHTFCILILLWTAWTASAGITATADSTWQQRRPECAFDGDPNTFWQGTGLVNTLYAEPDAPLAVGRVETRFNPDHLIDAEIFLRVPGSQEWVSAGKVRDLAGGRWVLEFPEREIDGLRTVISRCSHRLTPETPGEWVCVYEQRLLPESGGGLPPALPLLHIPERRGDIVIDGRIEAGEWDGAAAFAIFTWENIPASQDSFIRICADAENLYLAGQLAADDPAKIVAAGIGDANPLVIWGGDVLEIFIAAAEEPEAYRQLVVGPGGNRKADSPEVASAASIDDAGWTFEMTVPWRSLPFPAADGASLRLNFARDERHKKELSSWGPLYGGFHKPSLFGCADVDFSLPACRSGSLRRLSENTWSIPVGGEPEWTAGWYDFQTGDPIREASLAELSGDELTFSQNRYPFTGQLQIRDGARVIYRSAPVILALDPHETVLLETRRLLEEIRRLELTAGLTARLEALEAAGRNLSPADASGEIEAWSEAAARLRLEAAAAGPDFIAAVSAMGKILPHHAWRGAFSTAVAIHTARNEYENFQLLFAALERDIPVREVVLEQLRNAAGEEFPGTAVFYRVGNVRSPERRLPTALPGGLYPDPLLPLEPFTVPAGSQAAVWGQLHTPAEAAPGEYAGTVRVIFADGGEFRLPCCVTVHAPVLPAEHALATPFVIDRELIARQYHLPFGSREWADMVEKYRRFNIEHRLDWLYFPGGMQETLYPECRWDGRALHWDFTDFDVAFEQALAEGMHSFSVGFSWAHLPPITDMAGDPIAESGMPLPLVRAGNPALAEAMTEAWREYARHLREKGWFERAYYYIADEPLPEHFQDVRDQADALLDSDPEWRTMLTTMRPDALDAAVKIWCPNLAFFDPELSAAELARGKEVWWYVCIGSARPNYYVDFPGIDPRIHFWLTYRYGLTGVLYWRVNAWNQERDLFSEAHDAGDGYIFYPGPDGPWPSLRSAMIRDGIEDYDLFKLLESCEPEAPELRLEELCRSPLDYSLDPMKLEERRRQILEKLDAHLTR